MYSVDTETRLILPHSQDRRREPTPPPESYLLTNRYTGENNKSFAKNSGNYISTIYLLKLKGQHRNTASH